MKDYTAIDVETQLESLMNAVMNDRALATLSKHLPVLRSMLPDLATQHSKRIDSTVCELAACLSDASALNELASSLSPIELALINYRQLLVLTFFWTQPVSFLVSLPKDPSKFFVAVLNGDFAK